MKSAKEKVAVKQRILEIACFSYESTQKAAAAGAGRIEFCRDYKAGGLTPSLEDLKKIKSSAGQPVFVMIRPRGGNFVYSGDEFEQMEKEIVQVKELGFEGVVFGLLNEKNEIDVERTKILVELSRPLQVTFHRAFDKINDQQKGLEQLIELGIERVLTSGKEKTAVEGKKQLKKLNEQSKGRIIILAGGGVRSENVGELLECGMSEVHSSGVIAGEICDENEIRKLKKIISA